MKKIASKRYILLLVRQCRQRDRSLLMYSYYVCTSNIQGVQKLLGLDLSNDPARYRL